MYRDALAELAVPGRLTVGKANENAITELENILAASAAPVKLDRDRIVFYPGSSSKPVLVRFRSLGAACSDYTQLCRLKELKATEPRIIA
jgi:hypothetical protein